MDRGFLSGIGDFNKDFNPDLLLNGLGDSVGDWLGLGKNSVSNSLYGQQGNRQYEYSRHLDSLYNTDPNTQALTDAVAAYFAGTWLNGLGGGEAASGGASGAGASGGGAGYGLGLGEGSATGASGGLGFQNAAGSGLGFTTGGNTMGAGGGGLGFTMSPSVASTTGYGTGSMWGSSGGGFNTDLASQLLKNMNSFGGGSSSSSSGSASGSSNRMNSVNDWVKQQQEQNKRLMLAQNLRANKSADQTQNDQEYPYG